MQKLVEVDYGRGMDQISLRSVVTPMQLRAHLLSGTFKAATGAFILLIFGAFLKEPYLHLFGLPLLVIGVALICWGLIPYKQLKKLQEAPYKLTINPHDLVIDLKKRKPIVIPHSSIASLSYKQGNNPGIVIKLHPVGEEPSLHKRELFLPYFTTRSFEELEKALFAL